MTDLSNETQQRRYSDRLSFVSQDSSDDGLYPGNDHNLLGSNESFGSLWRQYSLINDSIKYRKKNISTRQIDLCFCCNTDSFRHGTLKGLFLLVVGVGLISSCLALRYSVFAPKAVVLTGGDQAVLPVSTYFNQQINVKEKFKGIGGVYNGSLLHVLPNIPPISTDRKVYTEGAQFLMPSWSYQYWGLHLLQGTELTISVCADLHLEFYVIKGNKKLKSWKETILFNQYDFQSSIKPKQACTSMKDMLNHSFTISESEIFYIIFSSSVGWRFFTEVNVIFSFNRTVYDTSLSLASCYVTDTSCAAKLRYASEDIVMIQTSLSSVFDKISLTYELVPRWEFYLKLFGSVYLGVIVCTVFYTIWRYVVLLRSRTTRYNDTDERRPLLRSKHKSYTLRSTDGTNKENWLIIKRRGNSQGQDSLKIDERETRSILENSIDADHTGHRRGTLNSNYSTYSTDSQESRQFHNRRRSAATEQQRVLQQNMEQQQLLDTVMTSAGVSAI